MQSLVATWAPATALLPSLDEGCPLSQVNTYRYKTNSGMMDETSAAVLLINSVAKKPAELPFHKS